MVNEMNEIREYLCANDSIRVTSKISGCSSELVDGIVNELDKKRGVMLSSRYEYPGRYTRWDIGFVNPPISIEAVANKITISALNERGQVLLPAFLNALENFQEVQIVSTDQNSFVCEVKQIENTFMEEDRSRMPHVMNVIRYLRDFFAFEDDRAGFYGVFGYDLGIDFMGVSRIHERQQDRDLVLYFADELFVTDHSNDSSYRIEYDFEILSGEKVVGSTRDIQREGQETKWSPKNVEPARDMAQGEYAKVVDFAKEYFARGDLFEVVPSQTFHEPCAASPSTVFNQLLAINPAPYGALINLGANEWTVSASPEMFVRVEGRRVESCPIAGTIARGTDSITDAEQIKTLLDSDKEKSELTMCTDVDRNDKSRVCIPATINVIGRRQIEMYSRLIHTVDHVEGFLEDGYDAIDAFLSHMWAVTVTGAPKLWAMNFIEKFEKSPRRFYGGAMGFVGLDGSMNTGLMLRTIHFHGGVANIRVGATLLADSDSRAEERETELKASAMLDVVRFCNAKALGENPKNDKMNTPTSGEVVITDKNDEVGNIGEEEIHSLHALDKSARVDQPEVLLIDCEDSFVHTLAGYFRMCGAVVHTRRVGFSAEEFAADLETLNPNLVCLSPGPGSPTDFGLSWIIEQSRQSGLPIFGVCLGLQALVEYFGGELAQLEVPMHGKPSLVELEENSGSVFVGIESPFEAGRYHSLIANEKTFPSAALRVTARTKDDGVIMGIEHISEPIAAVQFHPESIMTMDKSVGKSIIQNVLDNLAL